MVGWCWKEVWMKGWEKKTRTREDGWEDRRVWKQEEDDGKRRHNASVKKKIKIREAPLAISLHPSLFLHIPLPPHPLFLSGSHSILLCPTPLLFTPFFPFCPFYTHLPSLLLLLTPSLLCLLIRAGGTIVPLLPVFGNPGLKQSLFTQAVAQPGPSSSLQRAKSD